ncbi:hypothetical protein JCM10908_006770 [Rhodotorula pacifica]|uniref:uncharacterized protein n=1 Tax=Rhodotorula pacifica TaxID=1495444 RepID=UPI0031762A79
MSESAILAAQRLRPHVGPVTSLYTKKEMVGRGAYGGVYKATHNPTGQVVALKIIDLDTPDDDISEIQREVALLSELRDAARHNITLYHGCHLNGHELWIAMDFASGGSIRTLMKSGVIEEKYSALIIREVLVALAFLHRQDIIHRDVKAANVLLTQTGKILLADFGVAAHLQANSKRSTFTGTPLWMAPEVITDGKMYDTKADIWSLGITLFEMATGNPPHFGIEPLRACALIPRSEPPTLPSDDDNDSDIGPFSNPMREFLAQCLQIDATVRPTADELMRSKWIKSASKLPMALLRELIVRYVQWIQSGGQRMSIVGVAPGGGDEYAREDTFDLVEDQWDFDVDEEDFASRIGLGKVEPLGDEPARTLDEKAAQSHARPPKVSPRNHPLLRLFDEDSNPYAQSTAPTTITLPSGPAVNTVKPTISLPSFDDIDNSSGGSNIDYSSAFGGAGGYAWASEAATSGFGFGGASSSSSTDDFNFGPGSGGGGFGGAFGAAEDLMSPMTIREGGDNPFESTQPRGGGFGQGSSGSGSGLGQGFTFGSGSGSDAPPPSGQHARTGSQTPTETTFAAAGFAFPNTQQQQQQWAPNGPPSYPVANSSSLPSLAPFSSSSAASASSQLNRPFGLPPSSAFSPFQSPSPSLSPFANPNPNSSGPGPRRRADTAPSRAPYDPPIDAFAPYPPLGQGIPRAPPVASPALSASTPPSAPAPYPPLGPGLPRRAEQPQAAVRTAMGHRSRRSGSSSSRDFGGGTGTGATPITVARDLNRPFGAASVAGRDRGWSNVAEGQRPTFRAAPFPGPPGGSSADAGSGGGRDGASINGRFRSASEATKRQALQISTTGAFTQSTVSSPVSTIPATPLSAVGAATPVNGSPRSVRTGQPHRRIPSGQYFPSHPHSSPKSASAVSSSSGSHDGHEQQRAETALSNGGGGGGGVYPKQHASPRSAAIGGHRPRLSQSHTAPALPPVAEGSSGTSPNGNGGGSGFDRLPPRTRLRNVSSSSTLLGASTSSSSLAFDQTPLAAPAQIYEPPSSSATIASSTLESSSAAAAGIVAGTGQRASAIGYPFPPVGDLAVPGAGAGAGTPSSSSSPSAAGSTRTSPANSISVPPPPPPAPPSAPAPRVLPSSLPLKPLDYSLLSSRSSVQDELESTLIEMGRWLSLVSEGLGMVVSGEVELGGVELELGGAAEMENGEGETVRAPAMLQVSA